MKLCGLFLAGVLALAGEQPPDRAAQQLLLDGVKKSAQRYQDELPDFVCTLLTKRSEDRGGSGKHYKQRDTDEVEFRSVGRLPYRQILKVNNKPADSEPMGGFFSDAVLPIVGFLPDWLLGLRAQTKFEWSRWDAVAGRRAAVFHLHVAPADSELNFRNDYGSVMAGLRGFMYVDPATGAVIRLELDLEIPRESRIDVVACSFDLDYGPVAIADAEYYLPVRTVVQMRNTRHILLKNETDVVRYQKYAAGASIKFGEPDRKFGESDR